MINFYNQVPSIYPSASRDFQYLSWLINIVLNSVKHNVDDLYNLPNVSFDSKISELFALTLGFKVKRNYDQNQLAALAAILPSILRYKGTIKAVEMAAEALITASGALGNTEYKVINSQLRVIIPKDITIDVTLFLDLLDYILPAGMTCRVIREDRTEHHLDTIYVKHSDKVYCDIYEDLSWEKNNLSAGLAGLFDPEQKAPEFAANFIKSDDGFDLNAGLLTNTVIPVTPGKEIPYDNTVELLSTDIIAGKLYHKAFFADPERNPEKAVKLKAKNIAQEF
jgi:hypothetical protein